jgi:FKBP-type peptidyl-prolyl cis-trans isomerase FkpA
LVNYTFAKTKRMKYLSVIGLLFAIVFSSCSADQSETDATTIKNYITTKNLNAVEGPSGLWYVIRTAGSGKTPTINDQVEVTYKGQLSDGTVFENATNSTLLALKNTIKGWQVGLPLIKENGEITLIIPSALGYGTRATGNIPANSVLIFDIALLSVF